MKHLEELQERIDRTMEQLGQAFDKMARQNDLIAKLKDELARARLLPPNDLSRIHSIRDQIKFAEFQQCKCEREEDRDGVSAWHGYGQSLLWVLQMVYGVKP